jgi:stage II sporulation protein D
MIIRVLKQNGSIETMDMEDYVKGVVPNEAIPSWPQEALKAQAVAARTYALFGMLHAPPGRSWDICSTTS